MDNLHQYFTGATTFAEFLMHAAQEKVAMQWLCFAENYAAKLWRKISIPTHIVSRDDFVQEARSVVVQSAKQAFRVRNFRSYLFATLHTHMQRYVRRMLQQGLEVEPAEAGDTGCRRRLCSNVPLSAVEHTISDEFPGWLRSDTADEHSEAFERLLSKLPASWARCRLVLMRLYRDDQTHDAISQELGISRARVTQLHKRGLQRLREVCHAGN